MASLEVLIMMTMIRIRVVALEMAKPLRFSSCMVILVIAIHALVHMRGLGKNIPLRGFMKTTKTLQI